MEAITFTRANAIALYWEIATKEPEATRGNLSAQVKACRELCKFGYEPALRRLNELAMIDPARTKGNRRGQDAATELLKRLLSSTTLAKPQSNQSVRPNEPKRKPFSVTQEQ